MKKLLLLCTCAVLLLAGCDRTTKPADDSEAVHKLMANVVDVQAKVFWRSSAWVSDEAGVRSLAPTTEEGWAATRSAAAEIAEAGQLLTTSQFAEGRSEDWLVFARALEEIGRKAEAAAADRDQDALLETGGVMFRVCTGCHETFGGEIAPSRGANQGEEN